MNVDANRTALYRPPYKTMAFIALFGVLLPLAAIAIETVFGLCRSVFFDPLPTWFHTAMYATIPLANARLIVALQRSESALPRPWGWCYAFSAGIAILYSIVFLPISPIAVIAIVFAGLGLLGLSPLLAVLCVMLARKAQKKSGQLRGPKIRYGFALALGLFILLDLPASVTRVGMQMAVAQSSETRLRGVQLLRRVGSDDLVLSYCYRRRGLAAGPIGTLLELRRSIDAEEARRIFYQMTGTTFSAHPAPVQRGMSDWSSAFDNDRGGQQVGEHVKDVSLITSRMDGSVDADASLSYLEWTMEFENKSPRPQEGRAEVALPPGGVVSRATLWIDGEEREAAFGGRAQVRAAYEKVVRQQRDPLLVTTAGTDRVLVQLFPIPPNGKMQIRIGITAPLASEQLLRLPSFSDRNFDQDLMLRHAVWIESTAPLAGSAGLNAETGLKGQAALRGMLQEPAPGQPALAIAAGGAPPAARTWGEDDKDGMVILQTRSERPAAVPRRVAIVLDGSASMRASREQLAQALAGFPKNVDMAVVFAGDGVPVAIANDRSNSLTMRRYVSGLRFEGGRDNIAALAAAWDWASVAPSAAIVWVHGPQPVIDGPLAALQQRIERRPGQIVFHDLEIGSGSNLLAQKLDGLASMVRVPHMGSVADDLERMFAQWRPDATQTVVVRERVPLAQAAKAKKTSSHLARLWAAEQVARLAGTPARRDEAILLANKYQLVTPVSGAVVLATQLEYAAAGLEPVPPGSVPTIPEPETWLLIVVAMAALLLRRRFGAA